MFASFLLIYFSASTYYFTVYEAMLKYTKQLTQKYYGTHLPMFFTFRDQHVYAIAHIPIGSHPNKPSRGFMIGYIIYGRAYSFCKLNRTYMHAYLQPSCTTEPRVIAYIFKYSPSVLMLFIFIFVNTALPNFASNSCSKLR